MVVTQVRLSFARAMVAAPKDLVARLSRNEDVRAAIPSDYGWKPDRSTLRVDRSRTSSRRPAPPTADPRRPYFLLRHRPCSISLQLIIPALHFVSRKRSILTRHIPSPEGKGFTVPKAEL